MVCYCTRKSSKWGVCSLRGSFWPSKWVERAVRANRMHRKGLKDPHKKIWYFWRRNLDHPKNGVLYHTKIVEMRGMLASGSFDHPNKSDKPWWPTVCINKVLIDVHEKIWHFWSRNPDHPKNGVLIAHENCRNEGYARFGARLTFEMGYKSRDGQGLDGRPPKNLAFLSSESRSPKKWCALAHENH